MHYTPGFMIRCVCLFVTFFALSSVSAGDFRPCHLIASEGPTFEDFGAPYDVTTTAKPLLETIDCANGQVRVRVGNFQERTFVYHQGYIWKDDRWQRFEFSGNSRVGDWYHGRGAAVVDGGVHGFVVAYVCTRTAEGFKCGCRDSACSGASGNRWQIQEFRRLASCRAPTTSGLASPNPSCLQRWQYHTYRQLINPYIKLTKDFIDSSRRRALDRRQVEKAMTDTRDAYLQVFDTSIASYTIDKIDERLGITQSLVSVLPPDNGAREVARRMGRVLTSCIGDVTFGCVVALNRVSQDIKNDIAALYRAAELLEMENTVLVLQEFLRRYYRYGGDVNRVANDLELPPAASLEDMAAKVAAENNLVNRWWGDDYRSAEVTKRIDSFRKNVAGSAYECAKNDVCR